MKFTKPVWTALVGVLGVALLLLHSITGQETPKTVPLRLILVRSAADAEKIREQLRGGFDFGVLALSLIHI